MSRMKSLRSAAMRLAVYSDLALSAACGHAPPKAPPPVQRAAATAADLAGHWAASDDLDFTYMLAITPDGTLDLWIDRNKLGRCEEKGTLVPAGQAGTFALTYRVNDCHRAAVGKTQQVVVESFTGDALRIGIGEEHHAYTRVSDEAASTPRS